MHASFISPCHHARHASRSPCLTLTMLYYITRTPPQANTRGHRPIGERAGQQGGGHGPRDCAEAGQGAQGQQDILPASNNNSRTRIKMIRQVF